MAGRIPNSFIEILNDRINLVDVVATRVSLKKTGREYSGRCPFHDDSSPSFSVNPDKQVYHCFGCGVSGGLISFIMEFDRIDFISAIEGLASLAGLEIPREADDPEATHRNSLYQLLEQADQCFRTALRSHAERSRAVVYLKNRGLTGEVAHRFGVGFAPPGWRFLYDILGSDNIHTKHLLESGLTTRNSTGREYDRFRDRIIFPIRDVRGRTIAFGGRVLDNSKPKYLNSPETLLFHKSETLYGLYEARQANRVLDRVIVVEGYMDVVALAQHGIPFAVATLGTALTGQHLDRLSRQTAQVIVCFDGDQAGKKAAKRALDTMLSFLSDEFSIRFLFLPDGQDPDSLVRAEGQAAFLARLNQALPASEALIQLLSEEVELSKIDGRARLTALALPKIAKVPTSIYKSLMLDTLAEMSGTRRRDLDLRLEEISSIIPLTPDHQSQKNNKSPPTEYREESAVPEDHRSEQDEIDRLEMPMDWSGDATNEVPKEAPLIMPDPKNPAPLINRLLWLILQNPCRMTNIPTLPSSSQLINFQAFRIICAWLSATKKPTTPALMGHFSGTEIGRLLSLLLRREALIPPDNQDKELSDGLKQLNKQLITEAMHQLADDARKGKISAEDLQQALAAHKN
ncbi:DNA primase [Litorivicinus sp.]|nr:DNA primase [Litorivicinus sp.]MDC1239771.1 DNA primase [Litorivicinus sp.]